MGGTRLIDRVRGTQGKFPGAPAGAPGGVPGARPEGGGAGADFQRLKVELQNEIIEALDFEQVSTQSRDEISAKLRGAIQERVEARNLPLNRMEREKIAEEILDNLLGLGPLEQLIRDPEVNEIMVNGPNTVYIERKGKLVLTNIKFQDNNHLKQIIDRIVSAVGRRVDETVPMVDAPTVWGPRALDALRARFRAPIALHLEDIAGGPGRLSLAWPGGAAVSAPRTTGPKNGLTTSGTIRPMVCVFCEMSPRAMRFGT